MAAVPTFYPILWSYKYDLCTQNKQWSMKSMHYAHIALIFGAFCHYFIRRSKVDQKKGREKKGPGSKSKPGCCQGWNMHYYLSYQCVILYVLKTKHTVCYQCKYLNQKATAENLYMSHLLQEVILQGCFLTCFVLIISCCEYFQS